MLPDIAWQSFHDAALKKIELIWESGDVGFHIRTGEQERPCMQIIAESVCRLECPRMMPWGLSESINEIRGPLLSSDGKAQRMEIEMQSGDVVSVEAAAFAILADVTKV